MIIKLYINNERLDLFDDENISIKSSIADTQDITKNTTDFTKSFTVPATDINNEIFKHYYNANIDNGFDARIKVDGKIELDGIPFKTGKFRLNKVSIKNGQPSSYTINFWGNLISFKNKFKNDYISDLDLSAYTHDLDSANVRTGLTSSLFSGDIIYNLLVKKQYYYNSDTSDNTDTDELTNIAYNGGTNSVKLTDLRPSIKLKAIIEAIESKYNIAFTDDFFGRVEFDNLYMWLNNDSEKSAGGDTQMVDFDGGNSDYMNHTTNIGSYIASGIIRKFDLNLTVTPATGYEDVEYTIITYVDDVDITNNSYTGAHVRTDTIDVNSINAKEVYYEIVTNSEFSYSTNLEQIGRSILAPVVTVNTTSSTNIIESVLTVNEELPKIKVIDFLKGLFKMFKMVVIPIDEINVYVNTLNDYYSAGDLIDITKYVDFESYNVERGDILNEINYNFEDGETILQNQFKLNTGLYYGDEELLLEDEDGEPLDGDKLEYKLPFEQIIYERLTDLNDNNSSNIMYGAIIDESLEPTNIKPHIFYNINQSLGGKNIAFTDELGVKYELNSSINTPSHTIDFEGMSHATIFSEEFSEWDGNLISNTLYYNYHKEYIDSIFNVKRRNWNFTAYLPPNILTELSLNDVLKVKDNYYRIDNYNLNLLNGKTTFKLINSFDNTLNGFTPLQSSFNINADERIVSTYVANETLFKFTNQDEGFGTGWVAVTNTGGNIYFDVDANATGSVRLISILVENSNLTKSFEINITQEG